MPLMKPPHYPVIYNGTHVDTGSVNVLEQDVAAHMREGWEFVADVTFKAPAVVLPDEES